MNTDTTQQDTRTAAMSAVLTPQQMAALWLRLDTPKATPYDNEPQLKAVGHPGDWSIALAYDHPETKHYTLAWLASARRPADARNFKTLDAAFNAAYEVCAMVGPALRHPTSYAYLAVATELR